VLLLVEAREVDPRDAREHTIEHFQQHDLLALLVKHRGRLEPDIAAADHDDLARRLRRRFHRIGIGARTHALHPGQVAAGDRKHARGSAGCPHKLAVTDRLAVAGRHAVRRRIDADDALAEQHRHFALVPIFCGAELDAFEFLLAREIFLRQRRAFIGKLGLVADDRDAALELLRAQHHRHLCPTMAGPHDNHIELHDPSLTAYTLIARGP